MIYRFLTVVPTVLLGLVAAGASVVGQKPGETAVTPATGASRLSGRGPPFALSSDPLTRCVRGAYSRWR